MPDCSLFRLYATVYRLPGSTSGLNGFGGKLSLAAFHPAHFFLDALDVAAAEGLHFAAQLEIPADRVVAENSVAVHHRQRIPGPFDDLVRLELQVRLVRDGEDDGFALLKRGFEVLLEPDVLQFVLVAEESAPRWPGAGYVSCFSSSYQCST